MERAKHTLLIGATGMLSDAGYWLADRSDRVSVLSRHPDRFCRSLDMPEQHIHSLQCDYRRQEDVSGVFQQLEQTGIPVDLVLAWIHDGAVDALQQFSDLFEPAGTTVLRVHGSAFADPAKDHREYDTNQLGENTRVCPVVLGFVAEGARSRWLTHKEICDGVIAAASSLAVEPYIVGMVTPWSARP